MLRWHSSHSMQSIIHITRMKRNEKKMARSQLRLMFSVYEKRCFSWAWYRGMANAAHTA